MSLMINLAKGFIFPFLFKLEMKYGLTPYIIKTVTFSVLIQLLR